MEFQFDNGDGRTYKFYLDRPDVLVIKATLVKPGFRVTNSGSVSINGNKIFWQKDDIDFFKLSPEAERYIGKIMKLLVFA